LPYEFDASDGFLLILKNTQKQNPQLYERIKKKIRQILEEPHHYKELRNALKGCCRSQVGSFVLVFEIIESEKTVYFINFDHHDKVYG